MAEKLTDRVQIAVAVAQTDLVHIVDVSDTSQDPAGSSYKGTAKQLINSYVSDGSEGAMVYWDNSTSKYIPISTSGIYHDAVNNRIGCGINTGLLAKLHVKSASGTALQVDGSSLSSIVNVNNDGTVLFNTTDNTTPFGGIFTRYKLAGTNSYTSIESVGILLIQDKAYLSSSTGYVTIADSIRLTARFGELAFATVPTQPLVLAQGNSGDFVLTDTTFYLIGKRVGFGTLTPDVSAKLDVSSTTQGFLPPRMTTAQRDLIATPAEGLVIYNTTTQVLNFYNGTVWGAV